MPDPLFALNGRRAYITGAASGIGLAVAQAFHAAGAQVALADIADPNDVARPLGGSAVTVDVSDEASVAASLEKSVELLGGPLDIVVLNAGIGDVGFTLEDTELAVAERLVAINQRGVFLGLKLAPAQMADGGSIIATASLAAHITLPGNGIYSSTKRAVDSLVATAALELGHRDIRVNSICPGYTTTALGSGDDGRKICEAFTALGRVATVEDLVGVYRFLAADASGYVTGQALRVDGGWSCGPTTQLLQLVTGAEVAPT